MYAFGFPGCAHKRADADKAEYAVLLYLWLSIGTTASTPNEYLGSQKWRLASHQINVILYRCVIRDLYMEMWRRRPEIRKVELHQIRPYRSPQYAASPRMLPLPNPE